MTGTVAPAPLVVLARTCVYADWLRVERLTLRLPNGAVEDRHLEDHGAAVAVLPYDADRRTALVVTQPRAPVTLSGAGDLIEAIAGRIDSAGPEATARAEAIEEAGVRLATLEPVATIWSMPAISTERIALYLAPYTASDRIAAGGGSTHENECITVHERTLADLWTLAAAGALTDGKTLMLVQALRIRRPDLFEPR